MRERESKVPWRPPSRAENKYGGQGHDVDYGEARGGVSRFRHRPADCSMPGDGVSFQEKAGYRAPTA